VRIPREPTKVLPPAMRKPQRPNPPWWIHTRIEPKRLPAEAGGGDSGAGVCRPSGNALTG